MKLFDFLFGWRRASKCKRLIRKVQCRLKLLKNKRSCIARQSRTDVAQLLKHGLAHIAFDRVEEIIKDENMVELYDLLANYCEFVVINLPYIRKHKDCPTDINEAISTLIFSSARFGELPELLSIRKLFGERYGQKFVKTALELLPGNLVKLQIKESLYMKDVPDDVKYKFLDEIATTVESGPLLLEYKPYFQEQQQIRIPENDQNGDLEISVYDATETREIANVEPCDVEQKLVKPLESGEVFKFPIGNDPLLLLDSATVYGNATVTEDSASENVVQIPKEMVYLDDIEEFVSPVMKDRNLKDQRLFVFKSFGSYTILEERIYEKSVSRVSRSMKNTSRKRLRRRSVSRDKVTDVECAMYYGELVEVLPDRKSKRKNQRQRRTKSLQQSKNLNVVDVESSEHPKDLNLPNIESLESPMDLNVHDVKTGTVNSELQLIRRCDKDEVVNSRTGEEDGRTNFSRALTVLPERPNETHNENMFRWKSLPVEHPRDQSSCSPHIHPKLPDYDELAEKFMELKRANQENRQQSTDKLRV